MYEKLSAAAQYIQSVHNFVPKVGMVLGSGLGAYIDTIEDKKIIPYSEIPFFNETTVEGHQGRLILGSVNGVKVAVLQGRLHAYEGYDMEEIVFPVRTLATLGAEYLVLTNAAGGINLNFRQGDLVMINDHINLMGRNPLVGPNIAELGPRFPDMTEAYNKDIITHFHKTAEALGFKLQDGVYCSVLGPTYETPAEIRMFRTLGADMVGMSTVPESIAANHLGLKVIGVSCITNMAAGIQDEELRHEDIKDEALKVMEKFSNLLSTAIGNIDTLEK